MKKSELRSIIREIISEQNTIFSLNNIEDAISLSQAGGNIPNFSFKVCQLTAVPAGPISNPQSLGAGDGCFNYGISNPTTDELIDLLPLVDAQGYFPSGDNSCEVACVAILGCMDSTASNFDPNATVDAPGASGGCEWECTDPLYEGCGQSTSVPPMYWSQTPSGINPSCNNLISDGQAQIDANQIEGCTDSSADNYNPNATGCLATAQSFGGADPIGSGHGYIALGEFEANLCGATFTGITDPDNTDCCTYSSTSGNTNYMPGGVGNVTGPAGPTATLSTKDMDLSKPPQAGGSSADMTMKKDRMQKLANIKPRTRKR